MQQFKVHKPEVEDPLKFNIAPEKWWLEFGIAYF